MRQSLERIVRRLKQGPLSEGSYYAEFRRRRLAARIHEIREAGYTVDTVMVQHGVMRFGEYHLR